MPPHVNVAWRSSGQEAPEPSCPMMKRLLQASSASLLARRHAGQVAQEHDRHPTSSTTCALPSWNGPTPRDSLLTSTQAARKRRVLAVARPNHQRGLYLILWGRRRFGNRALQRYLATPTAVRGMNVWALLCSAVAGMLTLWSSAQRSRSSLISRPVTGPISSTRGPQSARGWSGRPHHLGDVRERDLSLGLGPLPNDHGERWGLPAGPYHGADRPVDKAQNRTGTGW